MSNPLLEVEWEACPLDKQRDPELEAFARKQAGIVPDSVPYLAPCPWLVRAELNLDFSKGLLTELDMEIAEEISMAVSQEASCRYCYSISRALLRIQGMSEAEVRDIEARLASGARNERAHVAINFARRFARANPLVTDQDLRQLETAGFSTMAAKELAFVAAYIVMANRVATFCALPPQPLEQMPDSLVVRLLRPLFAWMLFRRMGPGTADSTKPVGDTPHTALIQAYAGSPIGPRLEQVFRELWQSTLLSRRSKALMFAVVGKALGCDLSMEMTTKLLAEEGLDKQDLSQALNHLNSPKLDAVDNRLLPFARQTIWYKPAQIQREAASLLETLSAGQFVEAIGVLAFANGFCRLNAAVIEH